MRHYLLLLKKQMLDALPTASKKKRLDGLVNAALAAFLIAVIIAVFIFIFSKFTQTYTAIKINRVEDIPSRQYELMSIAYFALFVICFISGINRLCYTLFENSDINVLIPMPFSALEIFLSKLTWLYLRQVLLSALFVLPVNLTFFVTTDLVDAYNVLMTPIVAILLPIIPLSLASAIVLPFYYLKRFIMSHYILSFFTVTALAVGFCILYAYIFQLAEGLIDTGKLISLFNERTMVKLQTFAKYSYPSNLFANIMLKRELGKSIGILIGILTGSSAIGIAIIATIFNRVTQSGFAPYVLHIAKKQIKLRRKSRIVSLLTKEFVTVLRTPSYSFMYFTTAIIMPVMAFYSARLSIATLANILGTNVRVGFEICTFIVLLYGALTNTFCSTAISRDGYMSMTQKTLPYSPTQILSAKMILGGIVAETSIIACCVAYSASGLESPLEAFVTFLSATLLAIAQIAFSTRLDLNRPHFSKTEDGEIKEANTTVSVIILVGMTVCFAIGILLMYGTIKGLIGGTLTSNSIGISYAIALCIPLALLAAAVAFFFAGLKKAYANLDAEG